MSEKGGGGAPAWMVTFADLSTLLLCFFVLLLSFSEMDVAKFKQLAGSMKEAFGVQAEIKARMIPKGTSVVAREFSPAQPEPTALNQVRQFTTHDFGSTLDVKKDKDRRKQRELAEQDAARFKEALRREIEAGAVMVRLLGNRTIIHVLEKGSFDSGSADVKGDFIPVLDKVRELIGDTEGQVRISGHTDNIPITTVRYRSNWELSSARAVSVAHQLLKFDRVTPERLVVAGHADTRPMRPNDSPANRAKNRRVDISVIRGDDLSEPSLESQGDAS